MDRKLYIGGGDGAGILGLSPYASPLSVWLDKLGMSEPTPVNEPMYWGTAIEPLIVQAYQERTELQGIYPVQWMQHPRLSFVGGTPDALFPYHGLECKAVGMLAKGWGEPGTDEIPIHYYIQCCHYMAVTGLARWDVAVLFGGQRLEIYHLQRDFDLEQMMLQAYEKFWHENVLGGVLPTENHLLANEFMQAMAERHPGMILRGGIEFEALAYRRQELKKEIRKITSEKEDIENLFRAIIHDADGIGGDDWLVTNKATKKGHKVLRFKLEEYENE